MALLLFIIKILVMLLAVALMATPLLLEHRTIKKDIQNKIMYKRLRLVLLAIVYVFAISLVIHVLSDFKFTISNWSLFKWLGDKFAPFGQAFYFAKVYSVVLINLAIGLLYRLLKRMARSRIKARSLTVPAGKNGQFTFSQKVERKVIRMLHTETWFLIGRIVKWFCIVLLVAYVLIFLLYQIPALFSMKPFFYDFISSVFSAGYIYPILSLLVLWEFHFFMRGIERIRIDCPDVLVANNTNVGVAEPSLDDIDLGCKSNYGEYFICDVENPVVDSALKPEYEKITQYIAQAVENDKRNPKVRNGAYMQCVDELVDVKNHLVIHGNFFSEFSMYFFRYLSIILARGENIVFVCNNEDEIDTVYDYVTQGLSEITSLYDGKVVERVDFDNPIWKIIKISASKTGKEDKMVNNHSVLVTTLDYLCSENFEKNNVKFANLLDTIVFVDTINTINKYSQKLSALNTRLNNITKKNARAAKGNKNADFDLRYVARQVRYIGFDPTKTPGIDKVLSNMLSVKLHTTDIMGNNGALIRCYSYEPKNYDVGDSRIQYEKIFRTEENVGLVFEMATYCLVQGVRNVSVFVDDEVPYANIRESISAHAAKLSIEDDNLRINKMFYNPDGYSVMLVVDSGKNLPETIRKYTAMVGERKALVMIFSPNYMMRSYYTENIDNMWKVKAHERVPAISEEDRQDVAKKILVKANSGGISEEEIIALVNNCKVEKLKIFASKGDINSILREIIKEYGIDTKNIYHYFRYETSKEFNDAGDFVTENKVVLRKKGKLFDVLNGDDNVILCVDGKTIKLSLPKCRITQNFIEGQRFVYNGRIYCADTVDTANGRIIARLATGGYNSESHKHIQTRRYRVDCGEGRISGDCDKRHYVLSNTAGDDSEKVDLYISRFRAPMEVLTDGYYSIDAITLNPADRNSSYRAIADVDNDLVAKKTYRVYGELEDKDRTYLANDILAQTGNFNAFSRDALMMSVKLCGKFDCDKDSVARTLALCIQEFVKTMFPSVADSVAVCPVVDGEIPAENSLLHRYPKLSFISRLDENDGIEFFIIEDSASELGVVSTLGESKDVVEALFKPILDYLNWRDDSKKDYFNFGTDGTPSCFNFTQLREVLKKSYVPQDKIDFANLNELVTGIDCPFCGRRYAQSVGFITLSDGRVMCSHCANNLADNSKKSLELQLKRAKAFLESTYGINLDDGYDLCLESTEKIINTLKKKPELLKNGADFPIRGYVDKKKIFVESSVTEANLAEMLARQLTQIWQTQHLRDVEQDLLEGHIALVGIHYLKFLNKLALAGARERYYESNREVSGAGYRELVSALIKNRKYNNNPFRYLLDVYNGENVNVDEIVVVPKPVVHDDSDFGLRYTPSQPDRYTQEQLPYFYRSKLSEPMQKVYDDVLKAVLNFETDVIYEGITITEVKRVLSALFSDRSDIYYINIDKTVVSEKVIIIFYRATKEEVEQLEKKMQPKIAEYLSCVDDTMSAYDVALRLQAKMIELVDYDTVALDEQNRRGGADKDKIDYLRTICGVFIDGKVVCEGYARAMQYLLQKCGVECAEVSGRCYGDHGELRGGHSWNLIKADGDYYYLDATHDDPSRTDQTVKDPYYQLSFFGITSAELLRTRNLDWCPVEPDTYTATKCNYHHHNGLVLDAYSYDSMKKIAVEAAKKDTKFFTVKFTSESVYKFAMEQLSTKGEVFKLLEDAGKANKKIDGSGYETFKYHKKLWVVTVWFKNKK